MRAKVAESEVSRTMAEALRLDNLGAMNYVKIRIS